MDVLTFNFGTKITGYKKADILITFINICLSLKLLKLCSKLFYKQTDKKIFI